MLNTEKTVGEGVVWVVSYFRAILYDSTPNKIIFSTDCTTPFELYFYTDAKADIAIAANMVYSRGKT